MTFEYIVGGTLAALAIAYLLYVLLWLVLRPEERAIYRTSGIDETREQGWLQYAISLLLFGLFGLLLLYILQRVQGHAYAPVTMGGTNMADLILAVISIAVVGYLVFALIRPEKF
jgi:K+-transporting ATPase KdpF subunit